MESTPWYKKVTQYFRRRNAYEHEQPETGIKVTRFACRKVKDTLNITHCPLPEAKTRERAAVTVKRNRRRYRTRIDVDTSGESTGWVAFWLCIVIILALAIISHLRVFP